MTRRNSKGAVLQALLWVLPVIAFLFAGYAIFYVLSPPEPPQVGDHEVQLPAADGQKRSSDQPASPSDNPQQDRSVERSIQTGSPVGGVSQNHLGIKASGSPEAGVAEVKPSGAGGGSSHKRELQGKDFDQPESASKETKTHVANDYDSASYTGEAGALGSDHSGDKSPAGSYAITGQIVNEAAEPVSGIEVVAVAHRLFDEDAALDLADSAMEQQTLTDADGYFQFQGLADGEYQIRTVASVYYPTVVSTVTRTGVDSVKLVVVEQREVWVYGLVESTLGEPLAGAEITPITQPDRTAVTNHNGSFGFNITMKRSSDYPIRFWTEGYREQTIRVSAKEAQGVDGSITRDVVLEPDRALTVVVGTVTSSGSAVAGERVYLKSSQTKRKYNAVTDEAGAFVMEEVETGNSYILWISPQGPYQQYRENNVRVPTDGLNLDILLEAEGVGSLIGQMMDLDGNPIPNFSLTARSITSTQSPMPFRGDNEGYFELENVPEGKLKLSTSSLPIISVSGIQLVAGETKEVDLILDVGGYALQGRVLDNQGDPIPAANIILSWVYRDGGVIHESIHKTVSSADGRFELRQLGPGERTVTVAAPGFETVKLQHYVGGEEEFGQVLQVQLEDASS